MQSTIMERHQRYGIVLISIIIHLLLLYVLFFLVIPEIERKPFETHLDTTPKSTKPQPSVKFIQEPDAKTMPMQKHIVAPPQDAKEPTIDTTQSLPTAPLKPLILGQQNQDRHVQHAQQKVSNSTPQEIEQIDETQTVTTVVEEKTSPEFLPAVGSTLTAQNLPADAGRKSIMGTKHKKVVQPQNEPAKKLTMNDLAHGFVDSVRAYREQQQTNPAGEKQLMALHSYRAKIWSWLRQSFRGHYRLIHLCKNLDTQTLLTLTLAKDGSFVDLVVHHPSKTQELKEIESILLRTAKLAGLFPPIPKQLDTDRITLSFDFKIDVKEGFHSYDLLYAGR